MYKERSGGGGGGGSSRSEILGGAIDRKRINDALNKKLEKSSTSTTSRAFTSKDKEPFSFTSTSTAKSQLPDGFFLISSFPFLFFVQICGFCGSLIAFVLMIFVCSGIGN